MAVSGVVEGCEAEAGFGQLNDGIPSLLRGASMPGLVLWNGKVRTFQIAPPGLGSFDEVVATSVEGMFDDDDGDSAGRCFFRRVDLSSNVTFVVITFPSTPFAHAASLRDARLAAATPCSPYVASRLCMLARGEPTECEWA